MNKNVTDKLPNHLINTKMFISTVRKQFSQNSLSFFEALAASITHLPFEFLLTCSSFLVKVMRVHRMTQHNFTLTPILKWLPSFVFWTENFFFFNLKSRDALHLQTLLAKKPKCWVSLFKLKVLDLWRERLKLCVLYGKIGHPYESLNIFWIFHT